MPMLKTLEIYEVVSIAQADKRRAVLKRQVRDVASAASREPRLQRATLRLTALTRSAWLPSRIHSKFSPA
jgi:hypothetical protein